MTGEHFKGASPLRSRRPLQRADQVPKIFRCSRKMKGSFHPRIERRVWLSGFSQRLRFAAPRAGDVRADNDRRQVPVTLLGFRKIVPRLSTRTLADSSVETQRPCGSEASTHRPLAVVESAKP